MLCRLLQNAVLTRTTSGVYCSATGALHEKCPTDMQTPPGFFFRPAAYYCFPFFSYSSSLRGCPTKFSRVSSGVLVCSTAHLLTLIAARKSRFTNSIRFLPSLVVHADASSPRTFASFSFVPPSAVHTLLYLQGSSSTFPSPLTEVYDSAHGVYTMFETHLQVW